MRFFKIFFRISIIVGIVVAIGLAVFIAQLYAEIRNDTDKIVDYKPAKVCNALERITHRSCSS